MGRAPCCDKANVKRGPWSPEEDTTLKNYLHTHGTAGNWITLPHKAGLKRCGKSCRLRWLNYLRPDIKHGGFTEEEDDIICTLYKNIGSRWSLIASQLPGRTDNDVKNYWNTKLKKKLMAGLGKSNLTINTTTTITNNNNNSTYFTSLSSSSIPHHQNYYNFSSTSLNYPKPISVPSSMEMGLSLNPHQNLVSNPLGLISSSISVNNNNTNTSTTYSSSSPQEISGPSVSSSTDLALINNNYFSLSNGGGGGGGAGDEFESLLMDFGFGYSSTDVLINGLGFQEKPM